ncbi:MAG: SMP-30/gluconolactonase/LRE family protein [Acidimicrobiia bacterium]|nr:SMP-30/gluconolactonase/LRE family protein [Acidimicrobiia bacterium]
MQRPIEVMGEGLGHPEGPDMLPDGRVVFVETYTSDVKVWEEGKGISVYGYCGGGTNACIVGSDGDVYVTQNGGTVGAWKARDQVAPSIQRVKPDGTVGYVATQIDGVALNAPNDLAFGPNGSLYFTDSGEWDPVNKPDPSRIFELFPDGTGRVLQELEPVYTNGCASSGWSRTRWRSGGGAPTARSSTSARCRTATSPTASSSTPRATTGSRGSCPASSTSSPPTAPIWISWSVPTCH